MELDKEERDLKSDDHLSRIFEKEFGEMAGEPAKGAVKKSRVVREWRTKGK
jgi:hypothetical protein